jgi:hypothetical protein
MKYLFTIAFLTSLLVSAFSGVYAQTGKNEVYIDKEGRMRWQKDHSEVYLFGVNYTVPFAYGYRSLKALNKDVEKEIDEDVYHLARIGADAFRVHIWDTEISDTAGNLLDNEHLKLFDYLVFKLKQRNFHIIITPIAFWGNGYPQRDEKTAGFSSKYNKGKATVEEAAIKAQENYLKQLLVHVNPYTRLSYRDEPNIIAAELNNEPSHSGPKANVTAYINRLATAARSIGWTKPLFYNISQSPYYADAVAKSTVNGFSFQWYPTGLVAGHEQKGNFLPNVDRYNVPYDTIPEFHNKARMVYEFETADVLQPYLYPAIAKSFKLAGFQWVTQFAYDPLATAYANSEYQTHYLNLAYTPAKAISFLIANRVFHLLPRNKDYGSYPTDSLFDAFQTDYNQSLSAMNEPKEFYYTSTNSITPVDASKLEHVAGVGNSTVVNYQGSGAYFLDKLETGVWRLEVMPDAITVRDPFEKASPEKEVVHVDWADEQMKVMLPDISGDAQIKGINAGNTYQTKADDGSFIIKPGTYLLVSNGKSADKWTADKTVGNLGLNEFVAPEPVTHQPYLSHTPVTEVSADKAFPVSVKIINIKADAKVTLVANKSFGAPAILNMDKTGPDSYTSTIPAAQVTPGMLTYRVMIKQGDQTITYPGGHEGDPYAWDNVNNDFYQVFVASPNGKLSLFNATNDKGRTNTYFPVFTRNGGAQFTSGEETGELTFKASSPGIKAGQAIGFQLYVGDRLKYRLTEVTGFTKVVVRARLTASQNGKLTVALINNDGAAYAATTNITGQFADVEIPLSAFKPDSSLLLPRPYPGFQPSWFKAASFSGVAVSKLDKLEVTAGNDLPADQYNQPFGIEVESVLLEP